MVTEKEVRQASEAERILESDVFKLSLENLKKEYLQASIT